MTDDFASEPTAQLAQKLAEIAPGNNSKKVWFSQSGANAVEAAIKAARFYKYHHVSEIAHFLLEEKNIYVPSDKFGLWIVPPLTVSQEEIVFIVAILDEVLVLSDQHLA